MPLEKEESPAMNGAKKGAVGLKISAVKRGVDLGGQLGRREAAGTKKSLQRSDGGGNQCSKWLCWRPMRWP